MVRRASTSQEEHTAAVLAEGIRVNTALETAFLSEGNTFDHVRLMGLVNGTQQFLSGVMADLCDLSEKEYQQLQIDSITLFAKYAGFEDDEINIRE